jgi:hypothetical protein
MIGCFDDEDGFAFFNFDPAWRDGKTTLRYGGRVDENFHPEISLHGMLYCPCSGCIPIVVKRKPGTK